MVKRRLLDRHRQHLATSSIHLGYVARAPFGRMFRQLHHFPLMNLALFVQERQ